MDSAIFTAKCFESTRKKFVQIVDELPSNYDDLTEKVALEMIVLDNLNLKCPSF